LGASSLPQFLLPLLPPIHRELSDTNKTAGEELSSLAQEVVELLKGVCGKEVFSVAYARHQKEVAELRVKRRGQAALEVYKPCGVLTLPFYPLSFSLFFPIDPFPLLILPSLFPFLFPFSLSPSSSPFPFLFPPLPPPLSFPSPAYLLPLFLSTSSSLPFTFSSPSQSSSYRL
jgi:hypothetical protein